MKSETIPQLNARTPKKKSLLSYFSSPDGKKYLDKLEQELKQKKNANRRPENENNHASLALEEKPVTVTRGAIDNSEVGFGGDKAVHRKSLDNGTVQFGVGNNGCAIFFESMDTEVVSGKKTLIPTFEKEHVVNDFWSNSTCSQSLRSHHIRRAAAATTASRVYRADVFEGSQAFCSPAQSIKHIPIQDKLSEEDRLNLKECFDQLLRDVKQESKVGDMGLGRLEFGYPFKVVSQGNAKSKKPLSKKPVEQLPIAATQAVHAQGEVVQGLRARGRVVLIADADRDRTQLDQRGLPNGSSVVLIIDGHFEENDAQTQTIIQRQAIQTAESFSTPSKSARRNPLRDTVRLRWKVFHPQYTEKSEFIFGPSSGLRPPLPKRRLSSQNAGQKPKRNRDDDIQSSLWSEKYQATISMPVTARQPLTPPYNADVLPSAQESLTTTVEAENRDPTFVGQHPPSPPACPNPALSPIPLKFNAEEEAKIEAAVRVAMDGDIDTDSLYTPGPDIEGRYSMLPHSPLLVEELGVPNEVEIVEFEDEDVALPLLTPSLGTGLHILPNAPLPIEDSEIAAHIKPEVDLSTLPALPNSPFLEIEQPTELNEIVDLNLSGPSEQQLSLVLPDQPENVTYVDISNDWTVISSEVISVPSSPGLSPSTPQMQAIDGEGHVMKIVPYMPLTPPETPLAMSNHDMAAEFNMSIPLFTKPPPTPSSLLDSPLFLRGNDREFDNSPSPYFAPIALPPVSSPSNSILDSPLASRIRMIGGIIHEEVEEDGQDEPVMTEKAEDDDESDIEEIVRSNFGSPQISYPSPPSSPAPITKGKELARVPSFAFICSPSPPPSVHNMPINDAEDSSPESSVSLKGKEKEIVQNSHTDEQRAASDDYGYGTDDYNFGLDQSSAYPYVHPSTWSTADNIFNSHHEQYQYIYQHDNRPHTPGSSVGTLSRRWSGISRMSFNTNITTPPQTRPGSAIGNHSGNHKLLGWNDNDQTLSRSESFASSIRRDALRDPTVNRSRKPVFVDARLDTVERPTLRWSMSMPLIREQWSIRYPMIVAPVEKQYIGSTDDEEEYEVKVPGRIQLLPLTRGVIVSPPRIERRRRSRPSISAGPHRRKVKSLIQYSPDEQLEGIGELFEGLHELSDIDDEIEAATRASGRNLSSTSISPVDAQQQVEGLKVKKASLLKRLKMRASAVKQKVKTLKSHHKADIKGKSKAVAVSSN